MLARDLQFGREFVTQPQRGLGLEVRSTPSRVTCKDLCSALNVEPRTVHVRHTVVDAMRRSLVRA